MTGSDPRQDPPLTFDRRTGRLDGATLRERVAALAITAGARLTEPFAHRGFSLGCRILGTALAPRETIVQLDDDARFAFPFGDPYWSVLLDRRYVYEIELARFLETVVDVDYTFVDCGANYGLWSVLTTSRRFGAHRAIAIEASSRNAEKLRRNAALNGDRFTVRHQAIGATAGGVARLSGRKHEAFTIAPSEAGDFCEEVPVISLDSLIDDGTLEPAGRFIVKLDVEGVEIEALTGGTRLLAADTVILAEEHGADRSHGVTRWALAQPGCREFVLDPKTGRFEEVREPAFLDHIKTNHAVGYNVFVTRSAFWTERLRAASAGP
ncbi:FkbM family methyltransferase [Rhodoplanes sp. TEM]|uniref:FkbM family methyltransferase n=1 Tax=Rhodoplanes tepidamans TaxID=200616 RepID=A0ABT5J965_RHOTP|nr:MULTISPECIES: FkbM family methyltransferase [Rhodoplanes]MDC7785839.1 FkbM family methyltransferase [Rhodoplanes tepidamans]MDC7982756.1 FkbM family methyltransferase [Rhodoplanes sp. TEM]MDQ0357414.1 FkbM family methyltransferase [Rhodoplanes tepidamans]